MLVKPTLVNGLILVSMAGIANASSTHHPGKAQSPQPSPVVHNCLVAAAVKHGVEPKLLFAIAEQESAFNPKAVGSNTNGTTDYGLVQINSAWLPTLARYGIKRQALFDACINADVGAWILADNFRRLGVTWNAVGAYNAASSNKRHVYAVKVWQRLQRRSMLAGGSQVVYQATQDLQQEGTQGAVTGASGMGVWENNTVAETGGQQ